MKFIKKLVKWLLKLIVILFVIIGIFLIAVNYIWSDEYVAKLEKEWSPYWQQGEELLDKAKDWCIGAYYDVGDCFKYVLGLQKPVEGVKLRSFASNNLSNMVDFTIPDNWEFVSMQDDANLFIIHSEKILCIMRVQEAKVEKDIKVISEALITSLEQEYSDYDFGFERTVGKNIGVIKAESHSHDSCMKVAIVSSKGKMLIISYVYENDVTKEAENYFNNMLKEISESIK